MTRRFDPKDDRVVVVIGSGAGGGTLSNELAQKGIDVVCLEAGGRLTFADIVNDPPLMNQRFGWHDERRGVAVSLCKTVGGTTMRWTGTSPRLLTHEFRARTTYGAIDDTTLIDWPITLAEIEPYYDLAETKMGVSGTHGLPPLAENSHFKVIKAGARRIGYRDITTAHIAINSVSYDGRPACQQIGFCNSGCAIGAKWSTLYTEIPKAEQTRHFELRTNAMAIRISHDAHGKGTGVVYVGEDGVLHEQRARAVCVAGNVVETTRLLLLSESTLFPDGLANSSGHLGRNYMRHMSQNVCAVMPGPVHQHRGVTAAGSIRDEHRHDPGRGFVGGYILETRGLAPERFSRFAGWGTKAQRWMENFSFSASLGMCGEDPPQEKNRITLHPTDKDASGLPIPVLEYSLHPNTKAMMRHGVAQAREIFSSLGATDIRYDTNRLGGGCHNMGVARMSADPREGVTNRWGQAHDVPNLFISDGSVFSTSGAANPTLTIVALAIRQADYIADRMRRGEL
jgi:choline dehydrogenase-like flavoprotein